MITTSNHLANSGHFTNNNNESPILFNNNNNNNNAYEWPYCYEQQQCHNQNVFYYKTDSSMSVNNQNGYQNVEVPAQSSYDLRQTSYLKNESTIQHQQGYSPSTSSISSTASNSSSICLLSSNINNTNWN
jgi:hypothetical protein